MCETFVKIPTVVFPPTRARTFSYQPIRKQIASLADIQNDNLAPCSQVMRKLCLSYWHQMDLNVQCIYMVLAYILYTYNEDNVYISVKPFKPILIAFRIFDVKYLNKLNYWQRQSWFNYYLATVFNFFFILKLSTQTE